MKKSRIIVPALAMLVMSTAATVTGTVAWFSINKTVVATGMKVKAVGESSLVIKGTDSGSNFSSTANSTQVATDMKPATSYDGVTFAKLGASVKVENAGSGAATWSGGTNGGTYASGDLVTVDTSGEDEENVYYTTATYTIKSLAETKNVYVKSVEAVANDGARTLKYAIRVSVKMGSGSALVFNPNGGTNQAEGVGKYASNWTLAPITYVTPNSTGALMGSATANTEYPVTVNVWFEGQDTSCYSDNVDASNYAITLQFTTDTPSAS